jgi:serine/threonine protein kinase
LWKWPPVVCRGPSSRTRCAVPPRWRVLGARACAMRACKRRRRPAACVPLHPSGSRRWPCLCACGLTPSPLRLAASRAQLATMFHVASTGQHPTIPDTLSDECKSFLARCFARNPADRASAKELLRHPWFARLDKGGPQ